MQKLSGSQKGWFGIVIALWIIALAAMIFLLPKMSSDASGAAPVNSSQVSGSLAETLDGMEPSNSDAVAAELLDLRYVYGDDVQAFLPLCSDEPKELIDAKLAFAGDLADQIDVESGDNYMLLAKNPQDGVDSIDVVPSDAVDLCDGNFFDQFFSTAQGFPVFWDGDIWRFGARVQ